MNWKSVGVGDESYMKPATEWAHPMTHEEKRSWKSKYWSMRPFSFKMKRKSLDKSEVTIKSGLKSRSLTPKTREKEEELKQEEFKWKLTKSIKNNLSF